LKGKETTISTKHSN